MPSNLNLTPAERSALRDQLGGTAFVGLITPARGRSAGWRTSLYRTEEGAQRELNTVHSNKPVLRSIVLVDADGNIAS